MPDSPQPTADQPKGVLDAGFAQDRIDKMHLRFRYRTRALMAARMFQRHGNGATRPRLLELGAAEGATMAALHNEISAGESIGIEYSQDLIDAAPALPEGCRLLQGDATRADQLVPANSIDLVTALALLEHVDDPIRLAKHAKQVLRPGGLLVATCPAGTWDTLADTFGFQTDEYHQHKVNRRFFERLAAGSGLVPVVYRRFMLAPVGVLPYLRIPVSPRLALAIDEIVAALRIFDFTFVNQVFVARRP